MFESIKMYSLFIMISFPNEAECNRVNEELYGGGTKCFVSYEDPKLAIPPSRPKILERSQHATAY